MKMSVLFFVKLRVLPVSFTKYRRMNSPSNFSSTPNSAFSIMRERKRK